MAYGEFSWGGASIDLDAIPNEVQKVMILRTLKHIWGNEVAAKVFKLREKDGKTADIYASEYEPVAVKLREEATQKILDGTIGLRIGGPRGDTLENIAFELAMKQAEAKLAPMGYWPKADRKNGVKAEEATVEFAGRAMTREDLADMVFEKYRDSLMEAAKVEHAKRQEKARLAKANAVKPVGAVQESIENLI